MKTQILRISIAVLFMLSLFTACEKQEPLAETPTVVRLEISGQTTSELEFIYKDSVIFTAPASQSNGGGFVRSVQVAVNAQEEEIEIREKGSTNIIATRTVKPSPFNQTLAVIYEDGKVYDQRVTLQIKGYAMTGELEFLLDGKVLSTGSAAVDQTLLIPINENSSRELQVRIQGEFVPLITKLIEPTPSEQRLQFYFDGITVIDQLPELAPPGNPANMAITGAFASRYATNGEIPAFTNETEVDIVFFVRNWSEEVTRFNPEIRITVPTNGDFVTVELPPLPDENSFYVYDIYKKGTTELPYKDFDLAGGSVVLNEGRVGQMFFSDGSYFKAGSSKLVLFQDMAASWVIFPPDYFSSYNLVHGEITDLSQYFQ